ncbi:glycosyltransferase [Methylococcus geothermalis]|uniref:Glycosyltransferase n=1 Tax=Methylococcus geothermalis TaxID=2681310 RepID=A0A858QBW5_9GAMM|nr:glycosyltransferase [Methylococcus geothermalis]QJD31194.1 glycosyltransferase [Methylococcus geothermalis]
MKVKTPEKKPRLLVVLPANVIGGAETRTYNLLKGLRAFDRALLTHASISGFYDNLSIPIHCFDEFGASSPYEFTYRNIVRYAWAVRTVARREKSQLVLALMHNGTLFASMAKDIFFLGVPVVGTILGNVSAYFAALDRAPFLRERWIVRRCLRSPSGVITPSCGVRDDLIKNHGALEEKLRVIHNGVDIDRCRRMAREDILLPAVKDLPWIVSACRFSMQKDFRTLLAAFKVILSVKPAKLILVGDGELRDEVTKMASDLGILGNIVLTGFQENPFPYLVQADVFVLSSFFEGFGNVIVEAMALGVPVVASDCPSGPGEIIVDGESGFLVPVGDWGAMADRCLVLLGDRERRESLIQAGLHRAEVFGADAMVAAFEDYLMRTLKPKDELEWGRNRPSQKSSVGEKEEFSCSGIGTHHE